MKIQLVLNFILFILMLYLAYFKDISSILNVDLLSLNITLSFIVLFLYLKKYFIKILPYILFLLLFFNTSLALTGLSLNYFYFNTLNTSEIILNFSEILILSSFSLLMFKSIVNLKNKTDSILKSFTKLYSPIEFIFYSLIILFFIFVFLKKIINL